MNELQYTYFRGASGVVNGAGKEDSSLAIDENGLPIVCDSGVNEVRISQEKGY